jgi:hypothetical protein
MKNPFNLILLILLFSCGGEDTDFQLLQRMNFLEKENQTLRSQNEELLNDLKKCNQIIGENNSSKSKPIIDKQIVGKWKTPTLYGGGDLTIEKENGIYFKIERFMDNSLSKNEMTIRLDGDKMIFRTKGRNSSDHWVILKNGKLEVRDKDGLIYTSEPI